MKGLNRKCCICKVLGKRNRPGIKCRLEEMPTKSSVLKTKFSRLLTQPENEMAMLPVAALQLLKNQQVLEFSQIICI